MGQKKVINKAIARLKNIKSSSEFSGRAGARGKMRAQIQNLRALRNQLGSKSPESFDTQKPVTGKWGAKSKVLMNKDGNRLVKVAGVRRHEKISVGGYKQVVNKNGVVKSKPTSTKMTVRTSKVRLLTKKTMKKLGLTKYAGAGVSRAGGRTSPKRKPGGGRGPRPGGGKRNR
jgi:hypothetical protein